MAQAASACHHARMAVADSSFPLFSHAEPEVVGGERTVYAETVAAPQTAIPRASAASTKAGKVSPAKGSARRAARDLLVKGPDGGWVIRTPRDAEDAREMVVRARWHIDAHDWRTASQISGLSGVTSGQKSSLQDKLAKAQAFFDSGKLGSACGKLDEFIAQVNGLTPAKISPSVSAVLINSANALRTLYGCPA